MVAKAILLLFVTIAYGYNVDTRFPIIYSPGSALEDRGSYFGYAVHLYYEPANDVSWLIIGAPRRNYSWSRDQDPRQATEHGVVFRCTIDANNKTCQEVRPLDIGIQGRSIAQLRINIAIKKQYGWFGSAMSIDESNGMLTVCAPRTIISIFYHYSTSFLESLQGMCYSGNISSNTLLLEEKNLKTHDFQAKFWYDPMYGFSIRYAKVKRNGSSAGKETSRIIGKPKHETYGTVDIDYSSKTISVELPISDELSQFGFSTESGYFFDRNQLLYVSGAPGWEYVGQVAIINPAIDAPIVGKLHGTSVGEFFGGSLAVGDLDNDGLDDLLVGAPYWGQDNGKVYIYLGTEKGQFGAVAPLQGTVEGGHFGYAIASGDLDADGFYDIIVGAPWEESGVIYIYNGGPDMKDKKLQASQRIDAKSMLVLNTSPKIERFGFSISKPVDIDGNGYPDLAVGAYKSGHAIVLRSKPVAKTKLSITIVPEIIERDAKEFVIDICLEYDGPNIHSGQVVDQMVSIYVDEQYRRTKETFRDLRFRDPISFKCLETSIIKISSTIRDFIEPISILAKHEFLCNTSSNSFCKWCPMERKFNKLNVAKVLLPFNIGCGVDKVCNSNISATAKFHGVRDDDTWVIGSTDINLEINLSNHGEPAYLTTLEFVLPKGILLRSILPSCQEDTSKKNLIVTCDAGNPLGKEERNVKLDLDMSYFIHGSLHNRELNFYATIKSRSTNQGMMNVTKTLTLASEVSLSLNGKATEEIYHLSTMNYNNSIVSFQHTYQVYKLGATPIEDAQLIVKVPMAIKDSEPLVNLHKPQLYVSGDVFECFSYNALPDVEVSDEDPRSDSELSVQMSSDEIQQNEDFKIHKRDVYESSIEFDNTQAIEASQITNMSLTNVRYMNCSNSDENCTTIACDLSPLKTLQDIGKLPIKFLLNVQKLKDIFASDGEVLKFTTEASVEIIKPALRLPINGTRSTMETVTIFYKAPRIEELQLWIILVSISVGLLLLFIFAAILNWVIPFPLQLPQKVTQILTNIFSRTAGLLQEERRARLHERREDRRHHSCNSTRIRMRSKEHSQNR
ncbi:integrin alpha-8-like isoform X2 [Andrena cerasifolii]|uniref:integrin alpha-8-like isoform X2 n=1 Tax=Andrena cerasifolii TaxID=2819439 RepID=UPI0040384E7D